MGARVLLIADDAAVRRQAGAAMSRLGFEAQEARDGLSALVAIETQGKAGRPFQVVVTDAALPDFDGVKLLSVIKSRHSEMKVVVVAADASVAERVTDRKGDGFLAAPFESERLATLVGDVARRPAAAPVPAPTSAASAAPATAYLLIEPGAGLEPWKLLGQLGCLPESVYCDAVRDERFGMVMLLRGSSPAEVSASAKRLLDANPAVASWELLDIRAPKLPEELRGYIEAYNRENTGERQVRRTGQLDASYILVDVHPQHLAGLFVRLYFLDEVVEIDAAASERRIMLLAQARDFSALRRVIDERIRPQEGVMRVRELKVVPFARG
jgi:CheY-like chemotaxis protein